jgi:hypothetical protein
LKAKAMDGELETKGDAGTGAAGPQAVQTGATAESTTTKTKGETFNVVRRKSDGLYLGGRRISGFVKEIERAFKFADEQKDFDKEMRDAFLRGVFTGEEMRRKREKKTFNPTDYEIATVKIVTTIATTVTPVGPFVPPPGSHAHPEGTISSCPTPINGARYCAVDGCEKGAASWVWNPNGEEPDKMEVCIKHAFSRRLLWRSGRLYDTVAVVQP